MYRKKKKFFSIFFFWLQKEKKIGRIFIRASGDEYQRNVVKTQIFFFKGTGTTFLRIYKLG